MKKQTLRCCVAANAVLVLIVMTSPARADWLVTKEGGRVETKGPWTVKGKLVVFEQKAGGLGALRVTEVDLDQSAKATADQKAVPASPPEQATQPKKKPVLVLSDKDVSHIDAAGGTVAADAPAAGAGKTDDAKPAGGLVVAGYDKAPTSDGSGVEIFGSLRNDSPNTATNIAVTVKLYGEDGGLLGTAEAQVSQGVLSPGASTNFRAPLPGIISFARAAFAVNSRGLVTKPAEKPSIPGATTPPAT